MKKLEKVRLKETYFTSPHLTSPHINFINLNSTQSILSFINYLPATNFSVSSTYPHTKEQKQKPVKRQDKQLSNP